MRIAPMFSSTLRAGLALAFVGCAGETTAPDGAPSAPAAATSSAPLSFAQLSVGYMHTCGVTTGGKAYCWGANDFGQLGDGHPMGNVAQTRPVAVAGGLIFRHVSAGHQHTCGVTTDDRVYCWGQNGFGQIGHGTSAQGNDDHFMYITPTRVLGDRRYRQVRVGFEHSCAITRDQAAFCWGYGFDGELGDGGTTYRTTPVRVLGSQSWRQLSGGGRHTCGVTFENRVYCWGFNEKGQLGIGNTSDRSRPAPVSGGLPFRQVEAGTEHTCAITTEQRAYCWGLNFMGALGDGTTSQRLTPGAVAGLRRWTDLSAGDVHSCGVAASALAYCWGSNALALLGDGTADSRLTPTQVGSTLSFRMVSGNAFNTCAVTTTNLAYCWGTGGLLGDGTTNRRYSPWPVVGPN